MIFLLIQSIFAFTVNGSPNNSGFFTSNITISINDSACPAGFNIRAVVSDAIEVWNNVPYSSLQLSMGGDTTSSGSTNPPVAYCDASISGSTIGQGGGTLNSAGVITAGFLRFNANNGETGYILNFSYDRQVVVAAHEIGHMLGLGHSSESFALMHFSILNKQEARLSQDDMDGIVYLYPGDELGDEDLLGGCAMVEMPPIDPKGLALLLLFPMLLILLRRQKFIS